MLEWFDQSILTLIFSEREWAASLLASDPAKHLAICFAAKEAAGKCLGTGLAGHRLANMRVSIYQEKVEVKVKGFDHEISGQWFDCHDNMVCISLKAVAQ